MPLALRKQLKHEQINRHKGATDPPRTQIKNVMCTQKNRANLANVTTNESRKGYIEVFVLFLRVFKLNIF